MDWKCLIDKGNATFNGMLILQQVKDRTDLGILLEYAVPILSRVLSQNPLLNGAYYRGELIYNILNIDESFWQKHIDWKVYFETLLMDIFRSFSEQELENIVGERPYIVLKEAYSKLI